MTLNLSGDIEDLKGLSIISEELDVVLAGNGIPVKVEKGGSGIQVSVEQGKGFIRYAEEIHFYRGFGLLVEAFRDGVDFHISEIPQFATIGVMIDFSRNAVLKVESIKLILRKMALMGMNLLMLYMEDTYEITSKLYFGYMRGRYNYGELRECDSYAELFGIEIIPCIQTLAHLSEALKWNFANDIKDTEDILLVGGGKTYAFIEEMIKAVSAPFRSKRIHLGMDEAHDLGRGKYMDINGYRTRFNIMDAHMNKVIEITEEAGLKPMIWSDMYLRLGSKLGQYYDKESHIPQEIVDNIPKGTQLVFWDYYHDDEETYRFFIQKHRQLGCNILFAGGIWTWNGLAVNYEKTFKTTNAGLSACKKEGINEVFATMWCDNGAETNIMSGMLGMQLFAEHAYSEELDQTRLKKRFAFCSGGNYDAFFDLTLLNQIPQSANENVKFPSNTSKLLLWQDPLIGLFDRHIKGMNLDEYYAGLATKLNEYKKNASEWEFIFEMQANLAGVLSLKSELGVKIKEFYDSRQMENLKDYVDNKLPDLLEKVRQLEETHKTQWFKTNKPFGWEIIDIRYGGLIARIETTIQRIEKFVIGEIDRLEELEEERLFFDGPDRPEVRIFVNCNNYVRIISACPM